MLETAMELIKELDILEANYGWRSCFEFEAEYNKMDEIQEKISESLIEHGISSHRVDTFRELLKTVLYDYRHLDSDELEITVHNDLDEFIDIHFDDNSECTTTTRNLFEWLSLEQRLHYLNVNDHFENCWYVGCKDLIIEVHNY